MFYLIRMNSHSGVRRGHQLLAPIKQGVRSLWHQWNLEHRKKTNFQSKKNSKDNGSSKFSDM